MGKCCSTLSQDASPNGEGAARQRFRRPNQDRLLDSPTLRLEGPVLNQIAHANSFNSFPSTASSSSYDSFVDPVSFAHPPTLKRKRSSIPYAPVISRNFTEATLNITDVIKEVEALMNGFHVLKAEALCYQTLETLARLRAKREACGDEVEASKFIEAEASLKRSAIYQIVLARGAQYDSLCQVMDDSQYKLVISEDDGKLWMNHVPGGRWFEYKVAFDLDVSLRQSFACCAEVDLMPTMDPWIADANFLVDDALKPVTRLLVNLILVRLEVIAEVSRFVDTEHFGFVAETITSDFPTEGITLPDKTWRNRRVGVKTKNMFFPRGDGRPGSTIIQCTRVETGFPVSQALIQFLIRKAYPHFSSTIRKNAAATTDPEKPYLRRMEEDKHGLYKMLKQVEAVADKRSIVNVKNLPAMDIMSRTTRLT